MTKDNARVSKQGLLIQQRLKENSHVEIHQWKKETRQRFIENL